ncbi:DUF4276 family protein [Burkholderia lata]|uniref:DUF4276 family protein n=1 Tax=Burkholderia lata (strain ATCC 17760 / DSM 23089 / LMG 22485 / NCIMB 9086 / R18194 / 383) TaxID=482957 RepID=UPI0015838F29|nr:DUF4276 family protein [Burkholderia lata]
MYAVIGEHQSDVDTLANIIKRLCGNDRVSIKGKGFNGSGELLKRGASQLQLFKDLQCKKFIACYDSDGFNPDDRRNELIKDVFRPSGISPEHCVAVIPVNMIESWILADLDAISKVIKFWPLGKVVVNPEGVRFPKKHLEDLSEKNHRPRYNHATMNAAIAKHLNLDVVRRRCPSFETLCKFVVDGAGNL